MTKYNNPFRFNDIRFDNEIASSEEEFLSDSDDLYLISQNFKPPESELRTQVGNILSRLNPVEENYVAIVEDMLYEYLKYINDKQRMAKMNRIVEIVEKPISQQEKTELLIQWEIEDKKLDREFYYSSTEPVEWVCWMKELC